MRHVESVSRESSRHLTEALHQMLVRSRGDHSKTQQGKRPVSRFSMQNSLPSGDPPEVTMWGEA